MRKNDEMYQMFSNQGLKVAYGYVVIAIAGYVLYQVLIQHQLAPFWTFVMASQGVIWIIATQVFQIRRLGRAGVSKGTWVTLVMVSILLALLLIVNGFGLIALVLH
ncbi:hypothetical protein [Lacticaseibacillus nasuensis]|uniref:hypothetical protein n=1 Tax=Lacticaseibacillus nasuensis TaxID=944671 RepID=UPI000704C200|nr:hypothetical protein [Lacticaseibacillus nasuensis]